MSPFFLGLPFRAICLGRSQAQLVEIPLNCRATADNHNHHLVRPQVLLRDALHFGRVYRLDPLRQRAIVLERQRLALLGV